MRSGIAGTNTVSAYITIVATELRIAITFQAERGIFCPEDDIEVCNARTLVIIADMDIIFLYHGHNYVIVSFQIFMSFLSEIK